MAKLIIGVNDLKSVNSQLAKEWHPTKNGTLKPEHVTKASHKKVWWKCFKGHEWEAVIASRAKGVGCPFCSGRRAIPGETDLATIYPDLASEWHPVKNGELPTQVSKGSNKKVWWQCAEGHVWKAKPNSRTKGYGCPFCSGRRAISGKTDLATIHPELAAEWHPTKNGELTPNQVTKASGKKVWWKCAQCGNEWQDTVAHRSSGRGCSQCKKTTKQSQ